MGHVAGEEQEEEGEEEARWTAACCWRGALSWRGSRWRFGQVRDEEGKEFCAAHRCRSESMAIAVQFIRNCCDVCVQAVRCASRCAWWTS